MTLTNSVELSVSLLSKHISQTLRSITSETISTDSLTLPTSTSNLLTFPPTLSLVSHTFLTLSNKPSSSSSYTSCPFGWKPKPRGCPCVGPLLPSTSCTNRSTCWPSIVRCSRDSSISSLSATRALRESDSSACRLVRSAS